MQEAYASNDAPSGTQSKASNFSINTFFGTANALVYDLASFEEEDGRDVAHSVFHTDVSVVVDVDFANDGTSVIIVCQFLDNRSNHAARSAPFGPKVDNDRLVTVQCQVIKVFSGKFYSHFFSL